LGNFVKRGEERCVKGEYCFSYGAIGYLSGYFGAAVYNKLIVPKLGGIEIELE